MDVCTIIAKNYVAHARVLAESFRAHHPDGRLTVLVIDDFDGYIDPAAEPFEVIDIDSIGLDERDRMAASYDVTEFSTAVKPWLLRRLLERPDCAAITYLDPDIRIHDSLEEVDRLALENGLLLNPHLTAPLPSDGLRPNDQDILIAGAYNLGFISMRAGDATAELLDWWSKRLLRDCVLDPENGFFVDQRWIDLAPALFKDPQILRDPGYNVAYWNLPMRRLERSGEGYTVDGRPLRFFHFSGFDPLNPTELSKHQNRIDVGREPVLAELLSSYAEEVLAQGHERARDWPYGWDTLPGGITLDRYSRSLHRVGVHESRLNGSIFSRRGAKRLVAYLNEPDEGAAPHSGVTRYLGEMHRSRKDLQEAYPDLHGADAAAYIDWVCTNADFLGIPPALRPVGRSSPARNGGPPKRRPQRGINLAGYLSSELGVGEAARQVRSALGAAGIETVGIEVPVASGEMPERLGVLPPEQLPFETNLVCVNADMVPEFATAADPRFFEGRYSIALWFWEVAKFPSAWRGSFEPLDEVWVATDHVAGAVRAESPVPVETIRMPVTPVAPAGLGRAELGMPDDFCFLFLFDHRSVLKRKNPLGLIESFRRAFEPGCGASLVIKSMGGEYHPEDLAVLREAAATHEDVHLIEETIGVAEKNAMIANCDCYVSLHRSEGFGLTLAEAMYFGKPVIATGYSGNLDFMNEENSYLVGYEMANVGGDAPPYPADAKWADPDLRHAAELMRSVIEDGAEAARRATRAAEDIRRTHSPEAAGAIIEARLETIAERRNGSSGEAIVVRGEMQREEADTPQALTPAADPNHGMARVRHLLQYEQPPPKPNAGRLRSRAKRLYMRLLRPYAAHQQRINESMAAALDEVRSDVARRYAAAEQGRGDQIAELQAALMRYELRLDGLNDDQTELAATLGAIASEVEQRSSNLEQRASGLEQRASGLEQRAASLDQTIDTRIEERAKGIDHALKEQRIRTDRIGDDQQELAATLSGLVSDSEDRTEKLERSVDVGLGDLAARMAEDEEALRDNSRRLEALTSPLIGGTGDFDLDDDPALGRVIRLRKGHRAANGDGYKLFEDVFRGSEDDIRERQRTYLALVRGFAPVLDLGCGRGEFLDVLAEAEMEYTGVDVDPGMVARCREKKHEGVVEADAIAYLDETDEGSFGTVFSAQFVEHLAYEQLERLLTLSLRALRPGGLFIVESVNPHSPLALRAFWLDPTHRNPIYPEAMLTLCELAGFESAVAFCPGGSGDYERDRATQGDYAVLARAPEGRRAER